MQLCGCLPVGNADRDEDKQSNIKKQPMKRHSLKRGMFTDVMFY
jgi:hypothetical protein